MSFEFQKPSFWADALWERLKPMAKPGTRFYLAVYEKLIWDIAQELDPEIEFETAVNHFLKACSSLVTCTGARLHLIEGRIKSRSAKHCVPWALCLAAHQVLAVERMAADANFSHNAYFVQYRNLFFGPQFSSLVTEQSPFYDAEAFDDIWGEVENFLKKNGDPLTNFGPGLGPARNTNYPKSQALLTTYQLTQIYERKVPVGGAIKCVRQNMGLPWVGSRVRERLSAEDRASFASAVEDQYLGFQLHERISAERVRISKCELKANRIYAEDDWYEQDDLNLDFDFELIEPETGKSVSLADLRHLGRKVRVLARDIDVFSSKVMPRVGRPVILVYPADSSQGINEKLRGISTRRLNSNLPVHLIALYIDSCNEEFLSLAPKLHVKEKKLEFSGGILLSEHRSVYLSGYGPEMLVFNQGLVAATERVLVSGRSMSVGEMIQRISSGVEDAFVVKYRNEEIRLSIEAPQFQSNEPLLALPIEDGGVLNLGFIFDTESKWQGRHRLRGYDCTWVSGPDEISFVRRDQGAEGSRLLSMFFLKGPKVRLSDELNQKLEKLLNGLPELPARDAAIRILRTTGFAPSHPKFRGLLLHAKVD